jgi:hypothetical protein
MASSQGPEAGVGFRGDFVVSGRVVGADRPPQTIALGGRYVGGEQEDATPEVGG